MAELKDGELEQVSGGFGRGNGGGEKRFCPYCRSRQAVLKDQTTPPKSLFDCMVEGFRCLDTGRVFFVESALGSSLRNYYDQNGQLLGSGAD